METIFSTNLANVTEIIEPEKGCLANCQKAIWHVSFDAELIYKGADFICFFPNSDLRLLSLFT